MFVRTLAKKAQLMRTSVRTINWSIVAWTMENIWILSIIVF